MIRGIRANERNSPGEPPLFEHGGCRLEFSSTEVFMVFFLYGLFWLFLNAWCSCSGGRLSAILGMGNVHLDCLLRKRSWPIPCLHHDHSPRLWSGGNWRLHPGHTGS